MRYLLLGYIFLSTSLALACPYLAGGYSCELEGEEDNFEINITQTEANGITTYMFDDYQIIADGERHDDNQDDVLFYYIANCTEDRALNLDSYSRFYEDGELIATISAQSEFKKTATGMDGRDLVSIKTSDGNTENYKFRYDCTLLK